MNNGKTLSKSIPSVRPESLQRFIEAFEDLIEDLEYSSPEFWKEIKASRQSGVVSAKAIERRLGIK